MARGIRGLPKVRHWAGATSFGFRLPGMCSSSRLLAQILWPQSALLVTTPFPIPFPRFFRTKSQQVVKTHGFSCVLVFVSASSICRQLLIAYIFHRAAAAAVVFSFKLRDDRAKPGRPLATWPLVISGMMDGLGAGDSVSCSGKWLLEPLKSAKEPKSGFLPMTSSR